MRVQIVECLYEIYIYYTYICMYNTTDWFQIGKEVHQGCILSPCLFNLHADYIMRNASLDEVQAGIKITGRNINNLRYADDTTLVAESKELKSLFSWLVRSQQGDPTSPLFHVWF